MNKKLAVVGAGGHGRVCAEIAKTNGYEEIIFIDDADLPEVKVSGRVSDLAYWTREYDVIIAVGNNNTRKVLLDYAEGLGANIATLIHPSAVVSPSASIGRGSVICPGAVVMTGAVLGEGVIVNTCASVDHDCRIGDIVHVAVGARVAGTVTVGDGVFIGAGAAIVNNVSVCAGCRIGAGAAVVSDIKESGTYVGVPAKKIK